MHAAAAIVAWLKDWDLSAYEHAPGQDALDTAWRASLRDRLEACAHAEQEPLLLPDGSFLDVDKAEQTLARKEARGPFAPLRTLLDGRAVDAPAWTGQDRFGRAQVSADASLDVNSLHEAVRDLALAGYGSRLETDAQWDWAADVPDEGGAFLPRRVQAAMALYAERIGPRQSRVTYLSAPRALVGLVLPDDRALYVPLAQTLRAGRYARLWAASCTGLLRSAFGPLPAALEAGLALYAAQSALPRDAVRGLGLSVAVQALCASAAARADQEGAESDGDRLEVARDVLGAAPVVLRQALSAISWPQPVWTADLAAPGVFGPATGLCTALSGAFGPDGWASGDLPATLAELCAAAPQDAESAFYVEQLGAKVHAGAAVDWLYALG